MRKLAILLTFSGALALSAGSANAFCSLIDHSKSAKPDKTASLSQSPAVKQSSEAMSTFDPKNPALFEQPAKTTENSATTDKVSE